MNIFNAGFDWCGFCAQYKKVYLFNSMYPSKAKFCYVCLKQLNIELDKFIKAELLK